MTGRSEQGTTLLEVLVSVAILGLSTVALLGGLASGFLATSLHRQQADAGTILASAGEAVRDQLRNPFVPCATAANYNPTSGVALPPAWSSTNVVIGPSIGYWDGTQFQTASCSDLAVPPAAPSLTAMASGGVLGAGSYTYRLVYVNGLGNAVPGPEAVSVVVAAGTTNEVTVSWPAPPSGVAAVSVYGRSSGAEKFLRTVGVPTPSAAGSFVDTGAVTPSGPVPAASGNLQLITITVTSPNGRASQSRTFVKRGP